MERTVVALPLSDTRTSSKINDNTAPAIHQKILKKNILTFLTLKFGLCLIIQGYGSEKVGWGI